MTNEKDETQKIGEEEDLLHEIQKPSGGKSQQLVKISTRHLLGFSVLLKKDSWVWAKPTVLQKPK